ncbi:hypothetical protein BDY19DRAFT_955711 [Irpex rosettiformis]|uniref:Uncharacterized protein n=1 Tax=Irpex rosettiformis TaxID=378272 RepID=A0ACB8TZH2_9APHY|nr:hypothetical protein BDY19DRAFT_955711 [Irpex rosettiformis]
MVYVQTLATPVLAVLPWPCIVQPRGSAEPYRQTSTSAPGNCKTKGASARGFVTISACEVDLPASPETVTVED